MTLLLYKAWHGSSQPGHFLPRPVLFGLSREPPTCGRGHHIQNVQILYCFTVLFVVLVHFWNHFDVCKTVRAFLNIICSNNTSSLSSKASFFAQNPFCIIQNYKSVSINASMPSEGQVFVSLCTETTVKLICLVVIGCSEAILMTIIVNGIRGRLIAINWTIFAFLLLLFVLEILNRPCHSDVKKEDLQDNCTCSAVWVTV